MGKKKCCKKWKKKGKACKSCPIYDKLKSAKKPSSHMPSKRDKYAMLESIASS